MAVQVLSPLFKFLPLVMMMIRQCRSASREKTWKIEGFPIECRETRTFATDVNNTTSQSEFEVNTCYRH